MTDGKSVKAEMRALADMLRRRHEPSARATGEQLQKRLEERSGDSPPDRRPKSPVHNPAAGGGPYG